MGSFGNENYRAELHKTTFFLMQSKSSMFIVLCIYNFEKEQALLLQKSWPNTYFSYYNYFVTNCRSKSN